MKPLGWVVVVALAGTAGGFILVPAAAQPEECGRPEDVARLGTDAFAGTGLEWDDLTPALGEPIVPLRADLDGELVTIRGYLLPTHVEGSAITRFFLVPYVGGCKETPPPRPDQLVSVDYAPGLRNSALWDPILVTGTLSVQHNADWGFEIVASIAQEF